MFWGSIMSDHDDKTGSSLSGLTLGEGAPSPTPDPMPEAIPEPAPGPEETQTPAPLEPEAPALEAEQVPEPEPDLEDDPIEDALFGAFIGAVGTGADPHQAFGVAMFEARNAAVGNGIPEAVFDELTGGFKPIYEQCLGEGMDPREALKRAVASVEG